MSSLTSTSATSRKQAICPRLHSERVAGELGTHGFDSWAWASETTDGNSYSSSTRKVSFGADKLWQTAYCAWKNKWGVLRVLGLHKEDFVNVCMGV